MKWLNYFIILTLSFLIYSCDSTDPKPPETKPPGYQEDIPWPSLADSPWPISQGDPQATGRFYGKGPAGNVLWEYIPEKGSELKGGITVGPDSNLYFVTGGSSGTGLIKMNCNGEVIKKRELGFNHQFMTPLLLKDRIIVNDSFNGIFCFNYSLDTLWTFFFDGLTKDETVCPDAEGNLYFTAFPKVYSLDINGNKRWEIQDDQIGTVVATSRISISPDSKTIYIQGGDVSVIAVEANSGNIKWKYGSNIVFTSILVDNTGNLFFYSLNHDNKPELVSLDDKGNLNWKLDINDSDYPDNSICMTKSGTIYFAADSLYSISYKGEINWIRALEDGCDAPLLCDQDESVYINSETKNIISSFDINGNKLWEYTDCELGYSGPSSAFNYDGTMYCVLVNKKIIAFK